MSTTSRLRRNDAAPAGGTRTYVYGVVRRADTRAVRNEGVAGAEAVAIDHDGTAALTSAIPGKGEIRARRRDLLRHSDVLQEAFAAGPVVPLRFGTVAASAAKVVEDLLAPHHDELDALLGAFDGLAELSVRAFYREEEVLAEVVQENGRISLLRQAARSGGAALGACSSSTSAPSRRTASCRFDSEPVEREPWAFSPDCSSSPSPPFAGRSGSPRSSPRRPSASSTARRRPAACSWRPRS